MKNYKSIAIQVIGLIMVIVTLCVFFLTDSGMFAVKRWTLTFLLLAELAFTGGLLYVTKSGARHNRTFLSSGVVGTLSLYLAATFVLSLFANPNSDNVKNVIIIEIILLALVAVIIITTFVFSHRSHLADEEISNHRQVMQTCETRIHNLLVGSKNKNIVKQLNTLYEEIRFGDKVGTSTVDGKIVERIDSLETALQDVEMEEKDVAGIMDELFTLIKQRKVEFMQGKRGKF